MSEPIEHRDLAGKVISVGSRVAYFSGGRYDSINIAEVVEIRKRVKVKILRSSRGGWNDGNETWTEIDRLVVLEQDRDA